MEQMGALVEFDDAVDALGDVRRRELLLALLDRDPYDDPPIVGSSGSGLVATDDAIAMRHTHLPKLAEHGIVEWNRESNEVRRGPAFSEIRPMLELLDEHAAELPPGWT